MEFPLNMNVYITKLDLESIGSSLGFESGIGAKSENWFEFG